MRYYRLPVFLLLVAVVGVMSLSQTQDNVIRVPDQFSSISEALERAPKGALIEVDATKGPYLDDLLVLNNVSLISINGQTSVIGKTPRPECYFGSKKRRCEKDRINLIIIAKDSLINGFTFTGEFDTWTHISCIDCEFENTSFLDTNIVMGGDGGKLTNVRFDYSPNLSPFDPNDPFGYRENEDLLLLVLRIFNIERKNVINKFYEVPGNVYY